MREGEGAFLSFPELAVSFGDPFVGAEFGRTDRSAGMETARADADHSTHTVIAAAGKPRRRIDQN